LYASWAGELMVGGCFWGPRRKPEEFVYVVGEEFGDMVGWFAWMEWYCRGWGKGAVG
jgi:hypothetical protein